MKRKNFQKNKVNTCFLCGYEFKSLKEKHAHRINVKKGYLDNNIVILCENCKKSLQNDTNHTIYTIKLDKNIKNKYFSTLDKDIKQIILGKIRYFRSKNNEKD